MFRSDPAGVRAPCASAAAGAGFAAAARPVAAHIADVARRFAKLGYLAAAPVMPRRRRGA